MHSHKDWIAKSMLGAVIFPLHVDGEECHCSGVTQFAL